MNDNQQLSCYVITLKPKEITDSSAEANNGLNQGLGWWVDCLVNGWFGGWVLVSGWFGWVCRLVRERILFIGELVGWSVGMGFRVED